MKTWYRFSDWLGQFLKIAPYRIRPIVSVTYGCGYPKPDWRKLIVARGWERTGSLYYNGVFFFRFMLPFYVGFSVRWSGATNRKAFLQTHVGWKLNGDFAITLRIQSDDSAYVSNTGDPTRNNVGQARGWACGTK